MKDREKQIEEMAQAMSDFVLEDSANCDIELSRYLIAKGYRKQSDTAREILDEVSRHFGGAWLVELYKKYGVEVEE